MYETPYKFSEHCDDSVAFFACEKLLFLQGLLNHWCIDTESVPIAEDALAWPSPTALPLPEHHGPCLSGCIPMDDQEDLELEVDNYDDSNLTLVAAEVIATSGSYVDSDNDWEDTVEQVEAVLALAR